MESARLTCLPATPVLYLFLDSLGASDGIRIGKRQSTYPGVQMSPAVCDLVITKTVGTVASIQHSRYSPSVIVMPIYCLG